MKVKWDAHVHAAPESQRSDQGTDLICSSKGQHLPLCCLVDMVDQLPDPSQECVLMEISFAAILAGYEEKLIVLALILRFGQVDLKSSDWTNRAVLWHV